MATTATISSWVGMSSASKSRRQLSKRPTSRPAITITPSSIQTPVQQHLPHSLIISPNLDALLEYDERVRRATNTQTTPTSPAGPQSAPLLTTFPGFLPAESVAPFEVDGLPPPPRRARKTRSPTTPTIGEMPLGTLVELPIVGEGTLINPYINPAPSLEVLQGGLRLGLEPGPGDGRPGKIDGGMRGDNRSFDQRFKGQQQATDGRDFQVSDQPSRTTNRKTGKHRVEKLVKKKGKSGELDDVSNSPKLDDKTKKMTRPVREDDGGSVLDIRRHSISSTWTDGWDDETTGAMLPEMSFRRGPLISEEAWRRRSSLSSWGGSSSSTEGPASTIDLGRISISSTIYPASSAHSHPRDLYHDPMPVVSPPNRTSSLHSFIDISSPPPPDLSMPALRPDSILPIRAPSPKPPIPTTPKPAFNRSPRNDLPPTTNFLDLEERSELIRKNRKLARVFGQNPGPDSTNNGLRAPVRLHRPALSVSNHPDQPNSPTSPGRRHSAPQSPDHLSFLANSNLSAAELYVLETSRGSNNRRASSPTSFIDLSDDPPKKTSKRPSSPSNQSLFENMSPEEQADDDRRRKREKLAKLHRFLGSRVPANLVLGLQDVEASLPLSLDPVPDATTEDRKVWLRRRRSSSAAAFSSTWSDELDRNKEELDDKEKAINVRRAHKMEKVFGVAPPQTLYHTRQGRSPSPAPAIVPSGIANRYTSPERSGSRSAYTRPKSNRKSKNSDRPGTSESNKQLLPKEGNDPANKLNAAKGKSSAVYSHYQHSLNSLNDIIDRDDKESLAELHEYLSYGDMTLSPPLALTPLQDFTRTDRERRLSTASSIKSERRRSLPTRTSMISLASVASDFTIATLVADTPRPDVTDFQARRRRAAKLTQFFGVDYRELISDVLESIESGLEHERKRGTLGAEEVEDLLGRLRNLRLKRVGVF